MGDFNISCGISNISIGYGDKAGLMLLVPTRFSRDWRNSRTDGSLFHLGPAEHFTPFLAPIYGEYNDYGGLDNIERTETVAVLEDMFGLNIYQIVACAGGSSRELTDSFNPLHDLFYSDVRTAETGDGFAVEDKEKVVLLQSMSGMFFLREILELMKVNTEAFNSDPNYFLEIQDVWVKFKNKQPAEDAEAEIEALLLEMETDQLRRYWGVPTSMMKSLKIFTSLTETKETEVLAEVLRTTNHMFQPSVGGGQDNHTETLLALAKISKKFLKKRKAVEDSWE